MQKNYERIPQISEINYYLKQQLLDWHVPAELLTEDLDFKLIFKNLDKIKGFKFQMPKITLTERWQLQILGDFDYRQLENWADLRDVHGRTPMHYAAWSGNLQELILIKNPLAWWLKDLDRATPLHYAAWSGNLQALIWLNDKYSSLLLRKDKYGRTAIHYAAWSGNPEALTWINENYPQFWEQKDKNGATPMHYAAWSGNLQALIWLNDNCPNFWEQKDEDGKTPIHYAASSGNLEVLTWINKNYPQFWEQKDEAGRTPIHLAARSGNPDVFIWINENYPEFFQQRDNSGRRPIEHAALSGNPLALNKALSFQKNPKAWIINGFLLRFMDTLLKALDTNHSLMVVKIEDFHNNIVDILGTPYGKEVEQCLQRNRDIQRSKHEFQVVMQGVSQQTSTLFALKSQKDIWGLILAELLPESTNMFKSAIYNDICSFYQGKPRALKCLDYCIERLKPSKKENNYMFFGMLPHGFLNDSDNKITALYALKEIILNNSDNLGILISNWERQHGQTIAQHNNLFSELFSKEMTKTELWLENVKNMLNIETEQLSAQGDSPKLS